MPDKELELRTFTVKLAKAYVGATGNVSFSPISIALALGMLANGIKPGSASLTELLNFFGLNHSDVKASIEALNRLPAKFSFEDTKGEQQPATFLQANSVWGTILPAYKEKAEKLYHAKALPTPSSGKIVNDWVKESTKGHISTLFSEDAKFDNEIILLNTVYFRGLWKLQFKPENTHAADFHLPINSKVQVQMMKAEAKWGYAQNESLQLVQLPYLDSRFQAFVVLPAKTLKYQDALALIDDKFWTLCVYGQRVTSGVVELPRFEVTAELELSKSLAAGGVSKIFGAEASLSELTSGNAHVSKLLHKCRVEVDEEGSKASAATAVIMSRSLAPPPEPPFHLLCDRPFFFIIATRDEHATPLFFSYVTSPTHK
eukprot:TRINITY_DN4624_c0_g1_i1.p1 TRINITY_DN4624_c0_g1~~TRINITY_DN4624_c0_g1_i1.p1  ORF type:complete len:387 (-),score=93.21 TRINITY_DN4624_c0_g1_i1:50-1168(-)